MNQQEGQALDYHLTTPPRDCEDDGHDWRVSGQDEEGYAEYRCRVCGKRGGE